MYDRVWLGEGAAAEIAFPGVHLCVENVEGRLMTRGRPLPVGERLALYLGPVTLELEALPESPVGAFFGGFGEWPAVDLRVLVVTAAVALFGGFLEAMARFVETDDQASELVAALFASPSVDGELEPTQAEAAAHAERAPVRFQEGP